MARRPFRNRRDAGRTLAAQLAHYADRADVVVLALPRGGVPVGFEIAKALRVPLDIFVVRKLGAPVSQELAMGAIASGGLVVLNEEVIRGLSIDPAQLSRSAQTELRELERRETAYRGNRPKPDITAKTVILVDDGLATGSSMRAAVQALRKLDPARIVAAVPVAPHSTCARLAGEVDEVVCSEKPSPFYAVGQAYSDFTQTGDEEVSDLLQQAWNSLPGGPDASSEQLALRSQLRFSGPGESLPLPDVAGAQFVLLGESTHGTHEFYEERARITRWLIENEGFSAVAVEADWPDAYRVNRYVTGTGGDSSAEESLRSFRRFPTWMWRNQVVLDFVAWLREHNERRPEPDRVGFYGLDLYSLYASMQQVIDYLEQVDPEAATRAKERYACFDHYREDARTYAYAAAFGAGESCETEAIEQLMDLHRTAFERARRDGMSAEDERFHAEQNARTVKSAEEYYRTMVQGQVASWNLRDTHMADTLDQLAGHLLRRRGEPAKIVVWAHNSHVGDARATELKMRGELSLGQLVRERHPGNCFLLAFTTYQGTVTASDAWGAPAERKVVRPALPDSTEDLLHEAGEAAFLLDLRGGSPAAGALSLTRLERAIGVVYLPATERQSHYLRARIADQFDAVVHIDHTRAVEPLEPPAGRDRGDLHDTYPHAV